jgi:hypothetical protein
MAARKMADRLSAMAGRLDGSERTERTLRFQIQILDLRFQIILLTE